MLFMIVEIDGTVNGDNKPYLKFEKLFFFNTRARARRKELL